MPLNKRPPVYFRTGDQPARYAKLSKADWADAFCDLYFQVFGEGTPSAVALADAEHRIENLKRQEIR